MKPHECENESRVIEAVRSGRWDADLRRHAALCQSCADAALAARVLNEMRAFDDAEHRIRDAGFVWWKAQLLAKQAAGERATQPINFVERLACLCVVLSVAAACFWQWPVIRAWLGALAGKPASLHFGSFWGQVSGAFSAAISSGAGALTNARGPGLLLAVSAVIFLGFVAFAAYFALSER